MGESVQQTVLFGAVIIYAETLAVGCLRETAVRSEYSNAHISSIVRGHNVASYIIYRSSLSAQSSRILYVSLASCHQFRTETRDGDRVEAYLQHTQVDLNRLHSHVRPIKPVRSAQQGCPDPTTTHEPVFPTSTRVHHDQEQLAFERSRKCQRLDDFVFVVWVLVVSGHHPVGQLISTITNGWRAVSLTKLSLRDSRLTVNRQPVRGREYDIGALVDQPFCRGRMREVPA